MKNEIFSLAIKEIFSFDFYFIDILNSTEFKNETWLENGNLEDFFLNFRVN